MRNYLLVAVRERCCGKLSMTCCKKQKDYADIWRPRKS